MLAGYFSYEDIKYFYTEDFNVFYKDENKKHQLTNDDLKEWSIWLNSPWSQTNKSWIIKYNCESTYKTMSKNNPIFKCEYEIVGYDGISAGIRGYGNTQQEALQGCINHFNFLQSKYNKDNVSF